MPVGPSTSSVDLATQNFTQNILRGMGTGSSLASGSHEFALFKDLDLIEEAKQKSKLMPTLLTYGTVGKLVEGMQGTWNNLNLGNATQSLAPPPITTPGKKVPGIFNKRGGG